MEYRYKLLFVLVRNLENSERKFILDSIKNLEQPIRAYIVYLIKKTPESDKDWYRKKGISRTMMYRFRREAFRVIFDLLLKYYGEQDRVRDSLNKIYLEAFLGIRDPILKEAFEETYDLPNVNNYILWGDKFPWHWAEYVFFNIYEDVSISDPADLFLTIGDSVSAELLYALLLKQTAILTKRFGFPINKKHVEAYLGTLRRVNQTLEGRQFKCNISLLKLLSYKTFMMLLLRDKHTIELSKSETLEFFIGLLEQISKNKDLLKTQAILISDLAFVTFPFVVPLKPLLAQRVKDLIINIWTRLSVVIQETLATQELGELMKSWLFAYGFVKDSARINVDFKDSFPMLSEGVVYPPFMFGLLIDSWLSENWELLEEIIEQLGAASNNNFNRLIYYLSKGIVLIETNKVRDFAGHAMAFYQWARRNDFTLPLARLFRKMLNLSSGSNKQFYWLNILRELKNIYQKHPLLINIEFYIPLSIFFHFKHLQNISKEGVLKRYWEIYNSDINKIPHYVVMPEAEIQKHKDLFVQCISKLL